jgi:hypothetical protein
MEMNSIKNKIKNIFLQKNININDKEGLNLIINYYKNYNNINKINIEKKYKRNIITLTNYPDAINIFE